MFSFSIKNKSFSAKSLLYHVEFNSGFFFSVISIFVRKKHCACNTQAKRMFVALAKVVGLGASSNNFLLHATSIYGLYSRYI